MIIFSLSVENVLREKKKKKKNSDVHLIAKAFFAVACRTPISSVDDPNGTDSSGFFLSQGKKSIRIFSLSRPDAPS